MQTILLTTLMDLLAVACFAIFLAMWWTPEAALLPVGAGLIAASWRASR